MNSPLAQVPWSGVQPLTLQDFPGTPAAILYTAGCNMRCGYCHNKATWNDVGTESTDRLVGFLEARRGKLQGLVITGGEPTIHTALPKVIAFVTRMGYRVKLDTNGLLPERIRDCVQAGVDYVAMDIKGNADTYRKLGAHHLDAWERIKQSMAIIVAAGVRFEWRTTVGSATRRTNPEDMARAMGIAPSHAWFVQRSKSDPHAESELARFKRAGCAERQ